MTAAYGNSAGVPPRCSLVSREDADAAARVDEACHSAIVGRRAARLVAEWGKRLRLTEAELQILWRLSSSPVGGLDQTALANALAFSPAQISASVERLRARGCVCPTATVADRRRRHWQLADAGRELLQRLTITASPPTRPQGQASPSVLGADGGREAAA